MLTKETEAVWQGGAFAPYKRFAAGKTIKKATPIRCGLFYGGDYWTRTSDLLRVKIRLGIKCLLLGPFRYFWLRYFRTGKKSLSTVSTR